jgi:hypothetical protein
MLRGRFAVIAINAVIFIAGLGAMELGARWVQTRRLGSHSLSPPSRMDRWAAWWNAPGYARFDIHHNGQGFRRDAEVSLDKPPNTVRIFFLGGSTAYGYEGLYRGLDPEWQPLYNRDLIDVYLEKILQARHPERRWEVINAASPEYRMHQHLMLIYSRVLRFHPDLAIFMDGHNDMSGLMTDAGPEGHDAFEETPHADEFEAMVYPRSFRSLLFINATWLRYNSVLFDLLYRKALAGSQEKGLGPGVDSSRPVSSPVQLEALSPAERQRAARNLAQTGYYTQMAERLNSALAHEGIPAMFSLQPELILSQKPLTPIEAKLADHTRQISQRYITYMYEQMRPAIARQMAEAARRDGFVFADLEEAFRGGAERTFSDYCHLTPKGDQLVAEALYRSMEQDVIPKLIAATARPQPR